MDKKKELNDAIDLVQLAKVLLKRKWLIVTGTILFTLAAAIISFLLPKTYKTSGFYQLSTGLELDISALKEIQDRIVDDLFQNLPTADTQKLNSLVNDKLRSSNIMMKNISIPGFRQHYSQFTDPEQFLRFLKSRKLAKEDLVRLKNAFRSPEDFGDCIQPVYAYSKNDMKELVKVSRDLKNYVLGVTLEGEEDTPEQTRQLVTLMGEFLKDRIIQGKLKNFIETELNRNKTKAKEFEILILEDEFKLTQLKTKQKELETLNKKYPGAGSTSRELFSLANSGHRYLNPVSQLVGIGSYLADITENLSTNRRYRQLSQLKVDFFYKVREYMETEPFASDLLEKITSLRNSFFEQIGDHRDIPQDVLIQAKSEVSMALEDVVSLNDAMRFNPKPRLPEKPIRPRKAVITAVSFVFGFFFFIFFAFVVEWWQTNRKNLEV